MAEPEIPFMRAPWGKRGIVGVLREDGSIDPDKYRDYLAAKLDYERQFMELMLADHSYLFAKRASWWKRLLTRLGITTKETT